MHRVGTTVHRMYKTIHRVGTYSSLLVGLQLLVPSEAPQGDITAFVHTHATRKHFWNVPWLGIAPLLPEASRSPSSPSNEPIFCLFSL
jgi:hypothetical protein